MKPNTHKSEASPQGDSILNTINKIIGKNIQPKFLPIRAGDVFRTAADVSKIKKMLKFQPKVSFEEGLKITVKWFIQQSLKVQDETVINN